VQVVVAGIDTFRQTRSAYDILQRASAALEGRPGLSQTDVPFYQVGMYDQTVPFYLRRTTTVVEFTDELALGLAADPGGGIPTIGEWMDRWRGLQRGYALMSPTQFDRFGPDFPLHVLARDARRVIVSR
jgi:hypothetical protein